MTERQGKPKCFVVRHEGNDTNEHMSTMMWVRRRQLALPPRKSSVGRRELTAKVPHAQETDIPLAARWSSSDRSCLRMCGKRVQDLIQSRLYYHLIPVNVSSDATKEFGAVFNLEFSPLGDTLVTAYEGEAMQLFDPITGKLVTKIANAHTDCVNCIRFLDSRTFASGSDDQTIALWDIRNLKRKICTLKGHRNWVKSIEYCNESGLLITSAFDGTVLAWDINRYQEEIQYNKLFSLDTLMRTRLTPDSSKLIMSTSEGYYLVIHDLNLETMAADFENFDPTQYFELLFDEKDEELEEHASNSAFLRRRNKPEIVMDFPEDGLAECISSLVIHPQGWCMVSRYTTTMEDQEWTCVHDLQESQRDRDELRQSRQQKVVPPFKPKNRLLYYAVEPNDGKGYIKELSISPDGRIICSSFSHGVRLLAFDTHCSELCDIQSGASRVGSGGDSAVAPIEAQELKQVKLLSCHRATVLTSRFSPTQCLLASGCLEGKVVFHHPEL